MVRVQQVSHADAHVAIHDVRQRVFVQEQGIDAALERDALDPVCAHVLALDADGQPVGTGRLAPDGRIGRMAVDRSVRGAQWGRQLLDALVDAGQFISEHLNRPSGSRVARALLAKRQG